MKQNNNFMVIKKYGYNTELATFLKQIYDELVEYFGVDKEAIIYEAFLNTEVVDCDNIYEYLNSEGYLDETEIDDKSLNIATGICFTKSDITYDENSKTFELNGIRRKLLVCNLKQNEDYIKGSLIHELGHLVKNYYKSHEISGNLLIIREGFIKTVYELSYKDGKVCETLIGKEGVGLEEGLNSILEHDIAKKIVNPNYYVSGYNLVREIAKIIPVNLGLKEAVLNAQVMKEKDAFVREFDLIFMEGAFKKFESLLDKIYYLNLKQVAAIGNRELLMSIASEIDDVMKGELAQLLNEMGRARDAKKHVA